MQLQPICETNQWPAQMLLLAVEQTAMEDQKQAAMNGHILKLEDIRHVVGMRWLDAMMPAGNA